MLSHFDIKKLHHLIVFFYMKTLVEIYKVGQNQLVNRFHNLNNKICYSWFNDSFDTFKVKCKKLFLQ